MKEKISSLVSDHASQIILWCDARTISEHCTKHICKRTGVQTKNEMLLPYFSIWCSNGSQTFQFLEPFILLISFGQLHKCMHRVLRSPRVLTHTQTGAVPSRWQPHGVLVKPVKGSWVALGLRAACFAKCCYAVIVAMFSKLQYMYTQLHEEAEFV